MILLNFQVILFECLCAAVTSSQHHSSSGIRRVSPRRISTLVLRRRASTTGPLLPPVLCRTIPPPSSSSPPALRRAVPTSLPLHTVAASLSSITVSLPRYVAADLVAESTEKVTNAAVTESPVALEADARELTHSEDTSPHTGLYCCCMYIQYIHLL